MNIQRDLPAYDPAFARQFEAGRDTSGVATGDTGASGLDSFRQKMNDGMLDGDRERCRETTSSDIEIEVDDTRSIRLRIQSSRHDDVQPGILFIHGGGWFHGNLDTSEHEAATLAADTNATVVHLDYRLAPEDRYPAALDDCHAVWNWLRDNAETINVDPTKLGLAGVSAGGNLGAALCVRLIQSGAALPRALALGAPVLDLSFETMQQVPPHLQFPDATEIAAFAASLELFANMYIPQGHERSDPQVSPLLATNLGDFPPTTVVVGEYDPLVAESEEFVRRLFDAGVCAAGLRLTGHSHATWLVPNQLGRRAAHSAIAAMFVDVFGAG